MPIRNPNRPWWVIVICSMILILSLLEIQVSIGGVLYRTLGTYRYVYDAESNLNLKNPKAVQSVLDNIREAKENAFFYGSIHLFGLWLSMAWIVSAVLLYMLQAHSVRLFYWIAGIGLISGILRFVLLLHPPSYSEQFALYAIAYRWPLDLLLLMYFSLRDKSVFGLSQQP